MFLISGRNMGAFKSILVFSTPPGGQIDSKGAFKDSIPLIESTVAADSDTSPFQNAVSSGNVQFLTAFPILTTMSWPEFPFANTLGGAAGPSTWTYLGFVPASSRPTTDQVLMIQVQNAGTYSTGTCKVSTAGDVTFTAGTATAPGTASWTGNSPLNTGFFGFTMAWVTASGS